MTTAPTTPTTPVLAVIPARGSSTRVPGKPLRMVAGKPLIGWTITTLRRTRPISRIVVSTDDPAIASVARMYGVEVVDRPADLADNSVPVLEPTRHAAEAVGWTGPVLCAQPTTPLISHVTYIRAIERCISSRVLVQATVRSHRGRLDVTGEAFLQATFGAGFYVLPSASYRGPLQNFRIPDHEFCDIDYPSDLEAARMALARSRIAFRVMANEKVGSGHLHRALSLATELSHHDITFYMTRSSDWAKRKVDEAGFWVVNAQDFDPTIDLLINDCLDTSVDDVLPTLSHGGKVICLEDFGPGSRHADLVINELYIDNRPNALSGPDFAVPRSEFLTGRPYPIREEGTNLLVTFGGTDPADLSTRCERIFAAAPFATTIITPSASVSMAEQMHAADLVLTSAGRTVHEAASLGVPVVSIAANARESMHTHCPGVIRLGLHTTVSDGQVFDTVSNLMSDVDLRRELHLSLSSSVDGLGLRRIVRKAEDLLEGL